MLCGEDDANALGGADASIHHLHHRQPSLRCVLGRLNTGGHEGDVTCMKVFVPSGEGSGLVCLSRSFAECEASSSGVVRDNRESMSGAGVALVQGNGLGNGGIGGGSGLDQRDLGGTFCGTSMMHALINYNAAG